MAPGPVVNNAVVLGTPVVPIFTKDAEEGCSPYNVPCRFFFTTDTNSSLVFLTFNALAPRTAT